MIVLAYTGSDKTLKHTLSNIGIRWVQKDYSEPWRDVTHVKKISQSTFNNTY